MNSVDKNLPLKELHYWGSYNAFEREIEKEQEFPEGFWVMIIFWKIQKLLNISQRIDQSPYPHYKIDERI